MMGNRNGEDTIKVVKRMKNQPAMIIKMEGVVVQDYHSRNSGELPFSLMDGDGTALREAYEAGNLPEGHMITELDVMPQIYGVFRRLKEQDISTHVYARALALGCQIISQDDFSDMLLSLDGNIKRWKGEVGSWTYCGHRPELGCQCFSLTLERLVEQFDIDYEQTYVVTNDPIELGIAIRLGCRPIFVRSGVIDKGENGVEHLTDAVDILYAGMEGERCVECGAVMPPAWDGTKYKRGRPRRFHVDNCRLSYTIRKYRLREVGYYAEG